MAAPHQQPAQQTPKRQYVNFAFYDTYSSPQRLNGIGLWIQNNRHAYCFGSISSRKFFITAKSAKCL